MPLYQMIAITKCVSPQQTASLMSKITTILWQRGASIRQIKILSDRILAKQAKSFDGTTTTLGRYNQVLFDASPLLINQFRKQIKSDKNIYKLNFFRVKDFYSHAQQYTKKFESQIESKNRKMEIAKKIAILKQQL